MNDAMVTAIQIAVKRATYAAARNGAAYYVIGFTAGGMVYWDDAGVCRAR